MLLEVIKETTETVEVAVPTYYKDQNCSRYSAILEDGKLIHVNHRQITIWTSKESYYKGDVQKLVASGIPITEDQFMEEYIKVVNSFQAIIPATA